LSEYLHDNESFFDYLDMEVVDALIAKPGEVKTFREMYVHLGLLKSALVHATADDLFSSAGQDRVASAVRSLLTSERKPQRAGEKDRAASLEQRIVRYEETIATMEEHLLSAEERQLDNGSDVAAVTGPPVEFADLAALHRGELLTLEHDGVDVGAVDGSQPFTLRGRILAEALTNRTALLLFEGNAVAPFQGLAYSARLGGYFCYISPSESGDFVIELQPAAESHGTTSGGIAARVVPWQAKGIVVIGKLSRDALTAAEAQ
jgi:hypothetical protein